MADASGSSSTSNSLTVRNSAHAGKEAVPGTGGLIEFDEEYHRMKAFTELRNEVPRDGCDLPRFLYRIDLLPYDAIVPSDVMSPEERSKYLRTATIDLNYREGFPALPDGGAMWGQWPYEAGQLYDAFKEYLELRTITGIRSIRDLHVMGECASKLPIAKLWEALTYYYWDDRAQAQDLFQAVALKKMREQRILSSTNSRFLESERLLTQLHTHYFSKTEIDEEGNEVPVWANELNPQTAVKMYETLNKVQRESLGLNTGGSKGGEDVDEPTLTTRSGVMGSMQQIAEKGKPQQDRSAPAQDVLDLLRDDSDAAEKAQSLIIGLNERRKVKDAAQGRGQTGGMGHTGGADDGITARDEAYLESLRKSGENAQNEAGRAKDTEDDAK